MVIMTKIKMTDFATNKKLILEADAKKFYSKLLPLIKSGENIELDFTGIEYSVSSFFNASLGMLYKDKTCADPEKLIEIIGADDDDNFIIRKVMERAKLYYANPENFTSIDEV